MFTSILFDLDGTLLDTLDDLANSCNRSLALMGFPGHERESYRYFVGDGLGMLMSRVLPKPHRDDPAMVQRGQSAFRDDYSRNWNIATRLYEGMTELLDELAERKLRLAVLSNKPHEFTTACCNHYLNQWPFEIVLGQTDEFPRKPDPAAALEIARRMHEPTENFLYVGDTATDMKTAVSAGMFPVGALWGFRTRQELEESGARAVIAEPIQLLELLKRANSPA